MSQSHPFIPDSRQAWVRLALTLIIASLGSVGMWSVVVALPIVQADFGASRSAASVAFTCAMLGVGAGGVLLGRITDRFGIVPAIGLGTAALGIGYLGAGLSASLWQFNTMHIAIGLGGAVSFGPLIAEVSHWFERHRGFAMTVVSSGNYIAGTIWPPIIERGIATAGWRTTHIGIAIFCTVATLLVLAILRGKMGGQTKRSHESAKPLRVDLRLSANTLTLLLGVASIACCVAMAMPQVHIVAYCGDLGYGAARGAEMLSLMLFFGIISRIGSGYLADRIGGLRTLLLGSVAQGSVLLLYLFFDGLTSLYIISAMFGLFQGGIIPSYAIIIRETMPASEAATRIGLVFFTSLLGMSLGGWLSGVIFDVTGSYTAAFLNGMAWNALNVTICAGMLLRRRLASGLGSAI